MTGANETNSSVLNPLKLVGLNGSNPAGFLASLGVLATIFRSAENSNACLSWQESNGIWNPVIHSKCASIPELSTRLAEILRCPFKPDPTAERLRESRQKLLDNKRTELKRAIEDQKRKKLRGKERDEERAASVDPLESEVVTLRSEWLEALKACVPSSELALGKHLNAEQSELRDAMQKAVDDSSWNARETADMLAAFGSDACLLAKSDRMEPNPLCFVTGSGHQYFLDTVRQLTEQVTAERIETALSLDIPATDEKLSMRWDPVEDRRYALMWSDPTASDNKSLTNWAINLLGYHGLQLLPSAPTGKGLQSTGWTRNADIEFTWPIWISRLKLDSVRSIMVQEPGRLKALHPEVAAIFQSIRLQVGNPPLHKINFSPAQRFG
jgi:hypothetical protein